MKPAFYILFATVVALALVACNNDSAASSSKAQPSILSERANPSSVPVADFSENVTSEMGKLNHWKFSVSLYETRQTFTYRLQVNYAELNITDSFQFPDLGFAPTPALKKGKDDYSCIIGFMDNQHVFRDYKLVEVTDDNIHIRTLKYYGVQQKTAE